jgi:hypothetical protein
MFPNPLSYQLHRSEELCFEFDVKWDLQPLKGDAHAATRKRQAAKLKVTLDDAEKEGNSRDSMRYNSSRSGRQINVGQLPAAYRPQWCLSNLFVNVG